VKREEDACSEVEWLREFGLLNRNAKGGDALYFEILSCFSLAVLSSFLVLVFTTNQEHWIWFKDSCTCPQSLDKCVSPSRSASSFISFPIKQSLLSPILSCSRRPSAICRGQRVARRNQCGVGETRSILYGNAGHLEQHNLRATVLI
jgi:hypothetical protein